MYEIRKRDILFPFFQEFCSTREDQSVVSYVLSYPYLPSVTSFVSNITFRRRGRKKRKKKALPIFFDPAKKVHARGLARVLRTRCDLWNDLPKVEFNWAEARQKEGHAERLFLNPWTDLDKAGPRSDPEGSNSSRNSHTWPLSSLVECVHTCCTPPSWKLLPLFLQFSRTDLPAQIANCGQIVEFDSKFVVSFVSITLPAFSLLSN